MTNLSTINICITDSLRIFPRDNAHIVIIKNFKSPEIKDIGIYKDYARACQRYVVPPLYTKYGYMCMCVIDPKGNTIGEQKAIHINENFFPNLKCDDQAIIIDTPFGKLFLAVDVDIFKPEVIRVATLLGADVVINQQFVKPSDYNEQFVLRGAWQQAQQNCTYIINVNNISTNIIGPCMVTQDQTGYITHNAKQYPIHTKIIPALKDEAYYAFPIFDTLNPTAYNNHLSDLEM